MLFNERLSDIYELIDECDLPDIHSTGLHLKHKKSGARIAIASNTDPNKVFYIGFRTPPTDSTGVPHIIEHTVLCGSEKFPVKDPFIELLKGSMNTFLNAMTYPDKTMYPVASCNDKDFQNLMDVYMDSVLHPNIYKEENIFKQEGWHYELDEPDGDLTVNGVVYNEMKGAFSSGDSVLERHILNSLYPDTPYSMESGGDPDVIPTLTYENYLDFHRTYYHPSNSYIYIYGDMDVTEKLLWLDEAYLSDYDILQMDTAIPMQKPFDEPRESQIYYSISSTESEDHNTYLSCNWSIGTSINVEECIAYELLDYALLSSQGAPLKQALLDAGIGDDVYGGYDNGVYQPYYSIVAKNAEVSQKDDFQRIIIEVLTEQANGKLDKTTLLAAINGSEFKCREADFGRFPKGLMFGLDLMDSWLYDDNRPFDHLNRLAVYESLRQKLNTGYFEELIRKGMLENTHCTLVTVLPKKGLTAQKEKELKDQLAAYKASLSEEQLQELILQTRKLIAYQEEPSLPEQLETIPLLSREDMKKTASGYSNELETHDGIQYLIHDIETNGILYYDYLFDIHHLSDEMLPYAGILKYLMCKLDTDTYSYKQLADEVNLHTGGIVPGINVVGKNNDPDHYMVQFEIRVKTLASNFTKAEELTKSMMLHTLFSDEKRIYEVLAQTKSRLQSDLSESGHTVAATRALSYTSPTARILDMTAGIELYRVLDDIVSNYEARKVDLCEKMEYLIRSIFRKDNLLISVTAKPELSKKVTSRSAELVSSLYETVACKPVQVTLQKQVNEGFMDASQIQYVAFAGNFIKKGQKYHDLLPMFRVIMNYDYLWNNIRVKGGAYGCGTSFNRTGNLMFYSYRDPNLEETLEIYRNVGDYLRSFDADERTMTKYVIGTFNELDAPLTPISEGRRCLIGYLSEITQEDSQRTRNAVLQAQVEDIRALADLLDAVTIDAHYCVIGNETKLKEAEKLFEHLAPLA